MTPAIPAQIEDWLYHLPGWVSREFLCARFDITERQLRPRGDRAGLLDGFAISRHESGGGYIHIDHATPAEVGAWYNRKKHHGQAEIDGADAMMKRYQAGPRHRLPETLTQAALL